MNDQNTTSVRDINVSPLDPLAESVSALVDGELAGDRLRFLLRGMEGRADLAQRWSSYQAIGVTLRREPALPPLRADFSAVILQRIEVQVAVTTPAQRRVGLRPGVLRWVGGGAIAAAVAVVALVTSNPAGEGERRAAGSATDPSALADTAPPPRAAQEAYLQVMHSGLMPASDLRAINPNASDAAPAGRDYSGNGVEPYLLYVNPYTGQLQPQTPFPVQGAPMQAVPAQAAQRH